MTQIALINTAQQATDALSAGCQWLHLASSEQLEAVIPLAREAQAILTLQSDHERVMQTLIHGVVLAAGDTPAAQVREKLGPHAIIGCQIISLAEALELAPLDIDLFIVDSPDAAEIISQSRKKGVEQRFVTTTETPGADATIKRF